jgi:hypothetical protein
MRAQIVAPRGLRRSLSLVVALVLLSSCSSSPDRADYPVNQSFATQLTTRGVPADIARFFASAKLEVSTPAPNTFTYKLFYPNGAVRDLTLKFAPNQPYTLTEQDAAARSGTPIYAFTYANSLGPEWTGRLDMSFVVPNGVVPPELLTSLKATSPARFGLATVSAATDSGVGVQWGESAKEGADVAIGSVLDHYKDKGVPNAGKIGAVYGLASALSDVSDAMEIAKQNGAWLAELALLEECAANPTSQVAKNSPTYSKDAVAKVQSARSELKQANAVRFLNQMTDTGSGLTPATAVAAVALKQGFVWSEQTLSAYSENTIMREARLAVVPCKDTPPPSPKGNVEVVTTRTIAWGSQVDRLEETIRSNVSWRWNPARMQYDAEGGFVFSRTESSTAGGKTCTKRLTATGSLEGSGAMQTFTHPAAAQTLGYEYLAAGQADADAKATFEGCGSGPFVSTMSVTVDWLPAVKGLLSNMSGELTGVPGSNAGEGRPTDQTGTMTVKWKFALP